MVSYRLLYCILAAHWCASDQDEDDDCDDDSLPMKTTIQLILKTQMDQTFLNMKMKFTKIMNLNQMLMTTPAIMMRTIIQLTLLKKKKPSTSNLKQTSIMTYCVFQGNLNLLIHE